jgi:hypothetical protein
LNANKEAVMIASYCLHTAGPIALGSEDANCKEKCERQLATAEREMGAFVMAIGTLFGSVEASHAADRWIEIAGRLEGPLIDGSTNWRHITIAAASELAKERFLAETRVVKGDEQ